jgi:hypothetical protein
LEIRIPTYLENHVRAEQSGLQLAAILEGEGLDVDVPVAEHAKLLHVPVHRAAALVLKNIKLLRIQHSFPPCL